VIDRLFSLCWLIDGVHWLLIRADGVILGCSPCGFATEEEALIDLQYRN
jgi:hypothetical protein